MVQTGIACIFMLAFAPLLTPSCVVISSGEHNEDAFLHLDPTYMPGYPVGGENQSLLSCSAFRSHSHRPTSHVHDWHALLCQRDEMCKYSDTFKARLRTVLLYEEFLCCNWMCLCCSWMQMMPKWSWMRTRMTVCDHCQVHYHSINIQFINFQVNLCICSFKLFFLRNTCHFSDSHIIPAAEFEFRI